MKKAKNLNLSVESIQRLEKISQETLISQAVIIENLINSFFEKYNDTEITNTKMLFSYDYK